MGLTQGQVRGELGATGIRLARMAGTEESSELRMVRTVDRGVDHGRGFVGRRIGLRGEQRGCVAVGGCGRPDRTSSGG
jgi:hypothetical protein